MTSKPKHQHPVALVAFFYRWAVTLVVPYTIVIAVSVRRFWIIASVFAGLVLVSLIGSFASYWLFRYQMLADEIVVKQGLFVKKVKHVPYDRIQNVETNQWFFLKPFHIESVSIETAGHSDGPEIDLEAVTTDFKKLLNQQRQKAKAKAKAAEVATETAPITAVAPETPAVTPAMVAPKAQASYQISNRDLMKFAFTSPAFLSGFLAIFALYGKLGQTMQQKIFDVLFQTMAGLGMLILISLGLSVLLIFYIGSALVLIIRYYKFELVRQKTQFRLSSGLFKRKVMTIKLDRIQAVVIKQPLLRRWLGIATVKLVIISNSNQGETEKDVIMMPVLNRRSIPDFMARFLPSIPVAKVTPVQAAPRTYFYKLRNALLIFLPVALFSGFLFRRWWLLDLSWLLLMAVLWLIPAYLAAKRSGAQVLDATYVYVQNNQFFTLNQYFVPKNKIQAMLRKQSVWLAKRNFASLELQCRSGVGLRKIKANYLKDQMVTPVLTWYKQAK